MEEEVSILAKFGKKVHLESLKDGQLYFNPIQKYRNDVTDWRGDRNEGVIPIDPSKISIKNEEGKDIFIDLCIPRPTRISQFLLGDEGTFIFCSTVITKDILKVKNKNKYVLKDKFKKAIQYFGDYVLIFDGREIIEHLNCLYKKNEIAFGYKAGPIIYRDLGNFSENSNYKTAYNITESVYHRYVIKDLSYIN